MFSSGEFHARVERVLNAARVDQLDALLLVGMFPEREGHVCYLTNHRNWLPQWPQSPGFSGVGYSFCILTASGDTHLVAAAVDDESLAPVTRVTRTLDGYNVVVANLVAHFARRDARLGIVGLDIMPSALYRLISSAIPHLEMVDAEAIFWKSRVLKTLAERDLLAQMGHVADSAIAAAIQATTPGVSNSHISAKCVAGALAEGADHVLRCRLRSGLETTTVRWPFASHRCVEHGEFVQVDLVGVYRNYVFDVSRVWTVGKPTPHQRDMLELASALTRFLSSELRPGKHIDQVASQLISKFSSTLPDGQIICEGHSCGLDVVEPPWIAPETIETVQEGMFLNVEPHIRFAGQCTLKIEDQIIVGKDSNYIVNQLSHL